jgi:hypothetical protein
LNPNTGPPYFYQDGNYRVDAAFIFQKTHIKTTTYEAISATSYDVTIDDYDVLTGVHTITHATIDGKLPLALTLNSALSNLIQRPLVGTLDDNCGFVPSSTPLNLPWAESASDIGVAAKRANQRATAILRRVKGKANPLIRIGDTVRLIDARRSLDANHMTVARVISINQETGEASMTLDLEDWTR